MIKQRYLIKLSSEKETSVKMKVERREREKLRRREKRERGMKKGKTW